jgi:hypothetical protein
VTPFRARRGEYARPVSSMAARHPWPSRALYFACGSPCWQVHDGPAVALTAEPRLASTVHAHARRASQPGKISPPPSFWCRWPPWRRGAPNAEAEAGSWRARIKTRRSRPDASLARRIDPASVPRWALTLRLKAPARWPYCVPCRVVILRRQVRWPNPQAYVEITTDECS